MHNVESGLLLNFQLFFSTEISLRHTAYVQFAKRVTQPTMHIQERTLVKSVTILVKSVRTLVKSVCNHDDVRQTSLSERKVCLSVSDCTTKIITFLSSVK